MPACASTVGAPVTTLAMVTVSQMRGSHTDEKANSEISFSSSSS